MSELFYSVFGFLVAIAILVTVHEYGHFQVARKLGVKVLKFSIGFGKPIIKWRRKRDQTEYVIGMIPLGGYVKMLDEREGEVQGEEVNRAFNRQSLLVRSAIVAAGPIYNFLFAIVAILLVFIAGSDDIEPVVGTVAADSVAARSGFQSGDRLIQVDGREVRTWGQYQLYLLHQAMKGNQVSFTVIGERGVRNLQVDFGLIDQYLLGTRAPTSHIGLFPSVPPAEVYQLLEDSPAATAGLKSGDRIIAIDQQPIADWNELVDYVSQRPRQELLLTLRRADVQLETRLTTDVFIVEGTEYGRLGLYRPPPTSAQLRYGLFSAIPAAIEYNWRMAAVTLRSLGRIASARMPTENLSGPITIARVAGHSIETSAVDFLRFLAIISICIGLFNLLPIPLLDGGHLLYFAIEALTGSAPSERFLQWGQLFGIFLLALLMFVALYNDMIRLF